MIRRQGIPVPGFRVSSLVQPLRSQKTLNAIDSGSEVNSLLPFAQQKLRSFIVIRNLRRCTEGSYV